MFYIILYNNYINLLNNDILLVLIYKYLFSDKKKKKFENFI